MGDKKDYLPFSFSVGRPRDFAHLLHEEGLVLRMEVKLRLVDDQIGIVIVIQVRQQDEKLLNSVALISIESV